MAKSRKQKEEELDNFNRWLHPNLKWRKFAWGKGITIVPSSQGGSICYIYVHKGEHFRREGTGEYNQEEKLDIWRMYADIDRAYERFYNKNNVQEKEKKTN